MRVGLGGAQTTACMLFSTVANKSELLMYCNCAPSEAKLSTAVPWVVKQLEGREADLTDARRELSFAASLPRKFFGG